MIKHSVALGGLRRRGVARDRAAGLRRPGRPGARRRPASLQRQLNALRTGYDAKIADLEARLKAAEARAATVQPAAPAEPAPAATAAAEPPPGQSEVIIADATPEPAPSLRPRTP